MVLRPLEFSGGVDISVAENWMLPIVKHLRTIGSTDVYRVQLAIFLLRGDLERWWKVARQRFINGELSWVEFQEAFNEKYFLDWIKEQKT